MRTPYTVIPDTSFNETQDDPGLEKLNDNVVLDLGYKRLGQPDLLALAASPCAGSGSAPGCATAMSRSLISMTSD